MPKATEAISKTKYGVHPGVAMLQKWIAELKEKTGRSLEEWIAFAKKEGPKEDKARREWLKTKHKLGTNSASWISERVDGKGAEEDSPEARKSHNLLRFKNGCVPWKRLLSSL